MTIRKLTLSKIKVTILAKKVSVRKRLFTDLGRKMDSILNIILGIYCDLKSEKRKH